MRWLGLGRRESKRGKPEPPELATPETWLVDVRIDRRYYTAAKNHLDEMIVAANMKPRSSAGTICQRCGHVGRDPWVVGVVEPNCSRCGGAAVPLECEITFEFDATSDELAERMGRRAVERVGLDVLASRARRGSLSPLAL